MEAAGDGIVPVVATLSDVSDDPATVFGKLFDAHADDLHRYLSRRVGEVADDLLAETFLAAFAGRDGYDPARGEARSWLYGIATNLLRRHSRQELRRLRATASAGSQERSAAADPYDEVLGQVDASRRVAQLADAVSALDPADRNVLLMTAWGGLTSVEVALALGIPVGTVRSRLHRIRRQLRGQESPSPPPASPTKES